MPSMIETLAVVCLSGTLFAAGAEGIHKIDEAVQQVQFDASIRQISDCTMIAFTTHGVSITDGLTAVIRQTDDDLSRDIYTCYKPLGIDPDTLLANKNLDVRNQFDAMVGSTNPTDTATLSDLMDSENAQALLDKAQDLGLDTGTTSNDVTCLIDNTTPGCTP